MVADGPLRIVFFGTPAFALATLDALLASRHHVVGVVTRPDRPRGRGQKVVDSPVKARAVETRLQLLQPTALKDPSFTRALTALAPDLGVVAAYGRLLPDSSLAVPRLGLINVHASLLPKYRGAAPVHRAVIAGERETGVTIMRVVKALDAGPMIRSATRPIGPEETSAEIERDLARLGARLLVSVLDDVAAGTAKETPQDETAATYAPPLRKDEGAVAWSLAAPAIHNMIRGLHPWPHAFTHVDGRRLVLLRSAVPGLPAAGPPGVVMASRGDVLRVATGAGAIDLIEIQPEGRRPMTVRDFLAGHRIATGDRLTSR
jgi:methionyl-tRNA formyltransferase